VPHSEPDLSGIAARFDVLYTELGIDQDDLPF
jgi:hypothetical protein